MVIRILVLANGDDDGRFQATALMFGTTAFVVGVSRHPYSGQPVVIANNSVPLGFLPESCYVYVEVIDSRKAYIDHDYVFGRPMSDFIYFINFSLELLRLQECIITQMNAKK